MPENRLFVRRNLFFTHGNAVQKLFCLVGLRKREQLFVQSVYLRIGQPSARHGRIMPESGENIAAMYNVVLAACQRDVLKCAAIAEHCVGVSVQTGIRKIRKQPFYMRFILEDGVKKSVLLRPPPPQGEHLRPISVRLRPKNPTTVIFGFKYVYPGFMQEDNVNFSRVAVPLRNI